MAAISAVVTDLDGTLWHTPDRVHPRTVRALTSLARADVPLLVATGRRRTSAAEPLAQIGLRPPAVLLNGGLGIDLASDARFHRSAFPVEQATAVLGAFADAGLEPCVYVDEPGVEVFIGPRPSTHPQHRASLVPHVQTVDLARACAHVPVLAFGVISAPRNQLEPAADAIGDIAEVHLDRSFEYSGRASITVAPRGRSKWDAVVQYCRTRGLDHSRVLAIGDGPNDVELLANAALRLVPAGAHPAAAALADHVIGAAIDGGWADVLDHVG